MDTELIYDEQHPLSKRYAVFEDDGTVAYLYLTVPRQPVPVADGWIYNRIAAPSKAGLKEYASKPAPAIEGYAGPAAQYKEEATPHIALRWSADGEAVAAIIDGEALGFIVPGKPRYLAYNRNLLKRGPWGNPWDEALFQETFGRGDERDDK